MESNGLPNVGYRNLRCFTKRCLHWPSCKRGSWTSDERCARKTCRNGNDLNQNTVAHEAETERLRRQLSEVQKLQDAQSRIAELEGIVYTVNRIRQRSRRPRPKHHQRQRYLTLDTLAQEITRDEEAGSSSWAWRFRGGYDPHSDRLVDCKLDEICAQQDLAFL